LKIEIKNLKVLRPLSEETVAFVAGLWVDGVKAFTADNDGKGGCNRYMPVFDPKNPPKPGENRALLDKAQAWAKSLPPTLYEGLELPSNLDSVVDGLVARKDAEARLKRLLKANPVFKTADGKAYTARGVTPDGLRAKYGAGLAILNAMPFELAVGEFMGG
jgi:hypothetical protein